MAGEVEKKEELDEKQLQEKVVALEQKKAKAFMESYQQLVKDTGYEIGAEISFNTMSTQPSVKIMVVKSQNQNG